MSTLQDISISWDEQDRPLISIRYQEGPEGSTQERVEPDEWLATFADRLGDESAANLRAMIEINADSGAIALADLAVRLDVDKRKIDGWNRNLGRSVKAHVRDYGFLRKDHEDGTAQLFDYDWDQPNNRWLYSVPKEFRDALLSALAEE
jgi:hypothetical protein